MSTYPKKKVLITLYRTSSKKGYYADCDVSFVKRGRTPLKGRWSTARSLVFIPRTSIVFKLPPETKLPLYKQITVSAIECTRNTTNGCATKIETEPMPYRSSQIKFIENFYGALFLARKLEQKTNLFSTTKTARMHRIIKEVLEKRSNYHDWAFLHEAKDTLDALIKKHYR